MILDEIAQTALKARNISRRTGVAWALMDAERKVINCSGDIAGNFPEKLAININKLRHSVVELFISIEPIAGIFNTRELTKAIDASNINSITFGAKILENICDSYWKEWVGQWSGAVQYAQKSAVIEWPGFALSSLRDISQPWVTCVTAANLAGLPIALSDLADEFDVLNYVSNLVKESRALLYSKNQQQLVDLIAENNSTENCLEILSVDKDDDFRSLLRYCRTKNIFGVIILSDMSGLTYLLEHNLLDEIVHHIGNSTPLATKNPQDEMLNPAINSVAGLMSWHLLSSEVVGNCSRMVLSRVKQLIASKNGLN
jgi:hypothetical protein